MAATDSLTGLFNRRYFDGALEREIARIDRRQGTLALILLDIDHFKDLNDTHGHAMGDVALKKVAELVGRQLRRGDVLARFGGEEFVALLPEVTPAGAQEFAERIRKTVAAAAIHPGGPRERVTVSVGWALYPNDTSDGGRLVELAEFARSTSRRTRAGTESPATTSFASRTMSAGRKTDHAQAGREDAWRSPQDGYFSTAASGLLGQRLAG